MEKTKGIFLCCFGKRGYGFAAYNLAFSIKKYNPQINITLFHDDTSIAQLPSNCLEYFDKFIKIPQELIWINGRVDPANVKLNIYDYLPYDYNLYLDVDALALKDLEPVIDDLINSKDYYYTHVFGYHKISEGNDMPHMVWAWAEEVWYHFKLNENAELPGSNSSIQFIAKCAESENLFNLFRANYSKPIPVDNLRLKWGGGQPDELYINVSLAQCGWRGSGKEYVFFGNSVSSLNFSQIENDYSILSLFGGRNFTKGLYWEWYDRMLFNMHESVGREHRYKGLYLQSDKHANQTNSLINKPAVDYPLKRATLPIKSTSKIDNSTFIKSYKLTTGKYLEVINSFNPSWIKHNDKKYMCYRMEPMPFCTTTRLAMCLLNDDLQPIEGSHVMLNVHSKLKGYHEGYHVEDPRLFVYQEKLMLGYTDGYQMAMAVIDGNTLQATESYYLDKPNGERTEKNWTFFEDENKINCVYSIHPHSLKVIERENVINSYHTDWKNNWKFGELRGGSCPEKWNNEYLSFFHSSLPLGVQGRQYYMGAYTFESEPPYRVTRCTLNPIIAGEQMNQNIQRLSNKIFVVFPGGIIRNETGFDVCFGYNDYECRSVNITDEFLEKELQPV